MFVFGRVALAMLERREPLCFLSANMRDLNQMTAPRLARWQSFST
jgi:hypothetical protein